MKHHTWVISHLTLVLLCGFVDRWMDAILKPVTGASAIARTEGTGTVACPAQESNALHTVKLLNVKLAFSSNVFLFHFAE